MALADAEVVPERPVLYFSDLDAGGLRAARLGPSVARSAGWPAVVPCRELYEVTLASEHRLTQPPASVELAGWAEQWFGGHLGERVRIALVSGLIVRQEAVGLEQLSTSPGQARIFVAARCSTECYDGMVSTPEITQRDLRSRSREIMDAVEHGQSFTVTRDGHRIGQLVPIPRRRRFVSRQEFAAMSRNAPDAGLEAFRADQEAAADQEETSAYGQ